MKNEDGHTILTVLFVSVILAMMTNIITRAVYQLTVEYQSIKSSAQLKNDLLARVLMLQPTGQAQSISDSRGKEQITLTTHYQGNLAIQQIYNLTNYLESQEDCPPAKIFQLTPIPQNLPTAGRSFISTITCISNTDITTSEYFTTATNYELENPEILLTNQFYFVKGYFYSNKNIEILENHLIITGGSIYINSLKGSQESSLTLISLSGTVQIDNLNNFQGKLYIDSLQEPTINYPLQPTSNSPLVNTAYVKLSKGWVKGIRLG
jgi:hypothetical protein